jgi:hypothetical protein
VLARRRLVLAELDSRGALERDDRPHVTVLAAVVNPGDVIALVHRGRLNRESALARLVDQRERVDALLVAGGAGVRRER